MTSVERLKFLADKGDECWLGLSNVEAIKDVLKQLEEAQQYADEVWRANQELNEELETYKMLHLKSTASRVCNDLKTSEKHKEDLEMLYAGCMEELKKKDAVIDEMAQILTSYMSTIANEPYDLSLGPITRKMTLEEVKEYFYKKAEIYCKTVNFLTKMH